MSISLGLYCLYGDIWDGGMEGWRRRGEREGRRRGGEKDMYEVE